MNVSTAAAKALEGSVPFYPDYHPSDDDDDQRSQASEGSVASMSNYKGATEYPEFLYMGEELCRCLFKFKKLPHTLVCGATLPCRRAGHKDPKADRGDPGVYRVNFYRGTLDGIASSYMTKSDFEIQQENERQRLKDQVVELSTGGFPGRAPEESVLFGPSSATKPIPKLGSKSGGAFQPIRSSGPNAYPERPSTQSFHAYKAAPSDSGHIQVPEAILNSLDSLKGLGDQVAQLTQVMHQSRRDQQAQFQASQQASAQLQQALAALLQHQVAQPAVPPAPAPHVPVMGPSVPDPGVPAAAGGTSTAIPPSSTGATSDPLLPSKLFGSDSSKAKDELFGFKLRAETQIKRDLSPSGSSPTTKDDLAANLLDVVAMPGTYSGNDSAGDKDGTHLVAEAMRELMAQNSGGAHGERVRVDHGWRSKSRVSLQGIKSRDQLESQYNNLLDTQDDVLVAFYASTAAILEAGGMTESMAEQWSQHGFYARVARDGFAAYIKLHLHLLTDGMTHGWDHVTAELDYHCNKLWMICVTSGNRLICLCKTYCYLRNGVTAKWTNNDLLRKQMLRLAGSSQKSGPKGPSLCKKCKSALHDPSVPCPWKSLSDANARKAAADFLARPAPAPGLAPGN